MLIDWWRSMKTIIILLCLSPLVAVLIMPKGGPNTFFLSQMLCMLAFAIGFPVDWYRLQRRKRNR